MAQERMGSIIKRTWFLLFVFSALGCFLSIGISFLQPMEYASRLNLHLIFLEDDLDVFAQAEIAQGIAHNFSQAIFSEDFYDVVITSNSDIDVLRFDIDAWQNAVDVQYIPNSTVLRIRVLHTDIAQAKLIAQAIASIFSHAWWQYTSAQDIRYEAGEVVMGIFPARPNILLNGLLGFLYGLLASIGWIFIQKQQGRLRHRFIHEDF